MILQNFLKIRKYFFLEHYLVFLFFAFYFFIGLNIYRDYGISIDEPFHRSVGYFWYIWINENLFNNFQLSELKNKFITMEWSRSLVSGKFHQYAAFFDIIAAFLEEKFKITNTADAYYQKHLLNFCVFFISSFFFFLLVKEKFKNSILAVIATCIYISSPRIFAESFYNNKDIIFMAISVLVIYFTLKSFKEPSYTNTIILVFLCAVATQIRILGIFFFILYIFFFIISSLEEKKYFNKNIKFLLLFFFSYIFLNYTFWPYLWNNPINNFYFSLKTFSHFTLRGYADLLFMGKYISINNLPWSYIPIWIIATTPIIYLFFFFISFVKTIFFFIQNFLNIEKNNDRKIWYSINQKQDLYLLFCFLGPIFIVIALNAILYNGWRHLYFVYPSMIYFVVLGIKELIDFKKKIIKYIAYSLVVSAILFNVNNIVKYHPYQNVYFNFFFEKKANDLFEIDYWGLGNLEVLKHVLKYENKNKKVNIRTASFTPLNYSKFLLTKEEADRIISTGTVDEEQEYVFTNYNYERNPKFTKKYKINDEYSDIFTLKRGYIVINKMYKKNK